MPVTRGGPNVRESLLLNVEMTYDLFSFFNEYDTLEIRFNILDPYVDGFLIVEGATTFQGNPKPLYWKERDRERFKKWEHKVFYRPITVFDDEEIIGQVAERNYIDTNAFKRAFYQKETLRKMLEDMHLHEDDVVYYGDVDEIWKPKEVDDKVHKLRQIAYSYYLNNRSPEDWRGTIVTKWKNLKGQCLNDLRANPVESDILEDGGWHFSNLGGYEAVMHKIESYDHQEVNIPWVRNGLSARMEFNEDFLGRGWKFWVDESELPQYLLENKDKWTHLWKS